MSYLIAVSLIWAFSFGLIKTYLAGVDPNFVSFVRSFLALIFFLPVTSFREIKGGVFLRLFITGAVQFGLMYVFYIASFKFLKSYEVAVFTIFTPLYIALFNFRARRIFIFALMSVLGAGIITYKKISGSDMIYGFILVQLSNICFAYGQIAYKNIVARNGIRKEAGLFSIMFLGASVAAFIPYSLSDNFSISFLQTLEIFQIHTLLYLGIVASGLCFFLWNYGAVKTDNRSLAVLNNLKIPLAVLASVIVFKESTDYIRLGSGLLLISAALFWSDKK